MRRNAPLSTKFRLYMNERRDTPNIMIYEAGWEECAPSHVFGPTKREFYLLHYVQKGKGTYTVGGKTYSILAGEMFQIFPGVEHFYQADESDPWEYHWIGFNGPDIKTFLTMVGINGRPVIKISSTKLVGDLFMNLKKSHDNGDISTIKVLGTFYDLMGILHDEYGDKEEKGNGGKSLVSEAINYINSHSQDHLSVSSVALALNVNRSHLFRVFKNKMGVSIQEFLLNARLTRALLLLKDKDYSVKEIAEAVGYGDYDNFLKSFKKKYKVTPKEYRKDPFETDH